MTGEMFKPPDDDRGKEYWKGRTSGLGYRVLGDEAYLIRPNYPELYGLKDALRREGIACEPMPFDVYQGPYLACTGKKARFKIWYNQKSLPEFGDFIVEFRRGGKQKFMPIKNFDVGSIEARLRRIN
ncbi:hypothetical protein KKE60_08240 [Patescibacteria group bacterium]|nr:hypothetical protein [Patescibacteria group bacterium]